MKFETESLVKTCYVCIGLRTQDIIKQSIYPFQGHSLGVCAI